VKILGINIGHDSGSALVMDGRISAINEERLSRKKMHHGFPFLSLAEVLAIRGADYAGLDAIAVEGKRIMPQFDVGFDEETGDWKKALVGKLKLEKFLLGTEAGLSIVRMLLAGQVRKVKREIEEHFRIKGYTGEFHYIDHHYCHAATAYYTQPLDKGLVITLDASGEGYCSKVYSCRDNKLTLLRQVPCYHSPAYYYAYITRILGFRPLRHEGKITGLAAFGSPEKTAAILEKYIYFDKKTFSFVNKGGYHLEAMKRLTEALKGFSKEDVAAGIQTHTEKITCEYVSSLIERYYEGKPVDVFLAGGLFANVKVNQRILETDKVNSVYVFPNMGDGGVGLGAALALGFEKGWLKEHISLPHLYLGRNFTDEDIEKELKAQNVNYHRSGNLAAETAKLLMEKKVVARFHGAMEYGPRALGHRSIIYSAADKDVNRWLNQRLNRTEFMPFAPYVRDVDYKEYFKVEEGALRASRYMTITCDVTDKCKKEAPAITHVDGTARPQVIYREDDETYYDILTEYKKLSGCGVLVNTSFNMHEEPIINTPEEAVRTFKLGGLDILAIGNFIVTHG
jgi:carbamoyltransferase